MISKFFKGMFASAITQGFHDGHPALDIEGSYGTPLCAPEDCTVLGTRGDAMDGVSDSLAELAYGYGVRLKGVSGDEYLYWHCMPLFPVSSGDKVKQGQIVAYMGNSGHVVVGGVDVPVEDRLNSNHPGTHLHIEMTRAGTRIDPHPFIDWSLEPEWTKSDYIVAMMKVLGKALKVL
jgi:murein DD-endopeptidase MepM/ murein hydrolase activator NlpD